MKQNKYKERCCPISRFRIDIMWLTICGISVDSRSSYDQHTMEWPGRLINRYVYYLLLFPRVRYFRGIYKIVYIFEMTHNSDIRFLHNIDRWSTVLTKILISRIHYKILQNIWLKYSQPKFYKTWKTRRPLVSFKLGQKVNGLQYNPNFSFDVMSAFSC